MKKSKIIAPALGVLILSTAAAVTGTVAWFTASRIRNVGMTGISAVNPEQGLMLVNAKASNGSPVVITNSSGSAGDYNAETGAATDAAILSVAHKQLRDASVDVANGLVYGSVLDDNGNKTGIAARNFSTADTNKYNNQPVYFATSFQLQFKISRVESGYSQSLIFDESTSSVVAPSVASEGTSIKRALRIGFHTSDDWFVWAPFTTDTVNGEGATKLRYVSAAGTPGTETPYTAAQIITGNNAAAATSTYAADNTSSPAAADTVKGYAGYLGLLTEEVLTVDVYTWFEGCDSSCINTASALAQEFTANLQFTRRISVTYTRS